MSRDMEPAERDQATPVYWTPEDFAEFYRLKVRWVYARARIKGQGCLPHLRLGRFIRINVNSPQFKAWLERHQVGG